MPDVATESSVLRAWAEGTLSADDAFEQLYASYGGIVRAWLAVRAPADADDLFQDVWTIFCRRWREWTTQPGMEADARPVLSFLFRTCHLVLMAHRRVTTTRGMRPIEDATPPMVDGERHAAAQLQLSECLSAARACCGDEELAILTARLSGVAVREIARTLGTTDAAVDHRYRNAIARIRERLAL